MLRRHTVELYDDPSQDEHIFEPKFPTLQQNPTTDKIGSKYPEARPDRAR